MDNPMIVFLVDIYTKKNSDNADIFSIKLSLDEAIKLVKNQTACSAIITKLTIGKVYGKGVASEYHWHFEDGKWSEE